MPLAHRHLEGIPPLLPKTGKRNYTGKCKKLKMFFRVRSFPSTSEQQQLLIFYSMEKHRQRVKGRAISPAFFPYRFQKCWLFYHRLLKEGRKRDMFIPLMSVAAGLS